MKLLAFDIDMRSEISFKCLTTWIRYNYIVVIIYNLFWLITYMEYTIICQLKFIEFYILKLDLINK